MNLINQLGGYEEAKKCLDTPTARECIKNELRNELLKYRRENNIFEVGDNVVFLNENMSKSIKIIKSLEGVDYVSFNFHPFHTNLIRHATPEEIKAGRRL